MTTRWGAPVLAAGMVALAASVPAIGGYFGTTNYSGSTPPTNSAQTHFVAACADADVQTTGFTTPTEVKIRENAVVNEERVLYTNVSEQAVERIPGTIPRPHSENGFEKGEGSRLEYAMVMKPFTETIYSPVTETVMKESRIIVNEKVHVTEYKEHTVNMEKRVCEPVVHYQCYTISKPVCETVYRDSCHKVCKTVTETHFKECQKTVCTPVAETVMKERKRTVFQEVQETVYREICKPVAETVTCDRMVTKTVPEVVCENVCVRGHLAWKEVPKYECAFDPCTGSIVQKQIGNCRKLVLEPAHTVSRQITRDKIVVEQVSETKVVQRMVAERVPTTVTKKVPTTICEKIPITITRNVTTKELVKVPHTVTRKVYTTELVQVPEKIHRRVLGAYVDGSSLTAEAAKACKDAEFVSGGHDALCKPNAARYEGCGPGRVFVEGLRGTRTVTELVTRTVSTTEVRKVPCQVTKNVQKEVVKKVPTTVTRMVPIKVTRMVPCSVCRVVNGDVSRECPQMVTKCQPMIESQETCQPKSKLHRMFMEIGLSPQRRLFALSCGLSCGTACKPSGQREIACGPRTHCSLTACTTHGTPCSLATCKEWLCGLLRPSCPHPSWDNFGSLLSHFPNCCWWRKTKCCEVVPDSGSSPSPTPLKMPPTKLPASPGE